MFRYIAGILLSAIFTVFVGCSGFDSTQLLIHPESVEASETFNVALVNLYTYVAGGSTVSAKVERDSLHLLVGMPESWDIVSAKMAMVDDMNTEQLLALQNNVFDAQMMAALVQQYQSQAVTVPDDALLKSALSGKTITAHNMTATEDAAVTFDNVPQWKGFSAPVNIVLEKDSKTDTVVAIDSVLELIAATGLLPDSVVEEARSELDNPLLPDSIGFSMVPVIVFLQVKAGSQEGADSLYYFSKTGKMNPTPNTAITQLAPELSDLEAGDMTFVPITVTGASQVRGTRSFSALSAIKAVADRSTGTVRIDMGTVNLQQATIGIYSLHGNLVTTLSPKSALANTIVWNGIDTRGNMVRPGSYLVRIADNTGSVVRNVQMVR